MPSYIGTEKGNTMSNDPQLNLSKDDYPALEAGYKILLEGRDQMIVGLKRSDEPSDYKANVITDALITGLMAHFHEVASNKQAHATAIQLDGGNLVGYISRLAAQVVTDIGSPPTTAPQSDAGPTGRPPGHGRDDVASTT